MSLLKRNHYERLKSFPDALIILGDAVCSVNPLYGQGMTLSAISAEILDKILSTHNGLHGLGHQFNKEVGTLIDEAWMSTAANDLKYPQIEGKRTPVIKFIQWYSDLIFKAGHIKSVASILVPVFSMLTPSYNLFHPYLIYSAFMVWMGKIQPRQNLPEDILSFVETM